MRPFAVLAVVLVTIAPIQLHGQILTPAAQNEVRKAKDEVFVQIAGASREIHGRLVTREATDLTLVTDGRPYRIPLASVQRIETLTKRFLGKGAAIGIIGGLALGAWCSWICEQGSGAGGVNKAGAILGHVAMGGATGALSAIGARGRVTIYRAEAPGQPYAGPLPCPATPAVATSRFVPTDRSKWARDAWFSGEEFHALGNLRCDGLTIRRGTNELAGTWSPGVELHFKDLGNDIVSVTARITAYILKGERDKTGVIQVEFLQNGASLATSTVMIDACEGEHEAGLLNFRLPAAVIADPSGVTMRFTIRSSYN